MANASNPASASTKLQLADRIALKSLVESCLLVEEGVATIKDIELGLMMGAGVIPGPFARADATGLDLVLGQLTRAVELWGPGFTPPVLLRRLVAQGRLGKHVGQGFFAYPQPDPDFDQLENIKLERRGPVSIAWLSRPPVNPISPEVVADLKTIWTQIDADPGIRVLVIASADPFTFSAGADLKALTKMDPSEGGAMVGACHELLRSFNASNTITIAAVNSLAFGGGCELAMGCDFRIAAESATFGLPEVNLGVLPGFGGTQRLARLVGSNKALEMMLTGEPVGAAEAAALGLVNEVVEDHQLIDAALSWARRLAEKAPLAVGFIKGVGDAPTLDEGLRGEQEAFVAAFQTEDAREGIAAFVQKRAPRFTGR